MASGSETRQRQLALRIRLTADEHAAISAASERAGLSLAGYARSQLLSAPPVRQARRPQAERAELARLLGELGKIGSNANQMARTLNGGGKAPAPTDLAAMQADIAAIREAIMRALGRAPGAA
jgi:Bacterial mobilisation protein (MobC)